MPTQFALFVLIFISSCGYFEKKFGNNNTQPVQHYDINEIKDELIKVIRTEIRQDVINQWKEEATKEAKKDVLEEYPLASKTIDEDLTKQKKAKVIASKKPILGRIEWVSFGADNIKMKARIDTGAKTSSLHAENIQEETISGDLYVKFNTFDDNNQMFTLLRPVVTQQKGRSTSGKMTKRYVIRDRVNIVGKDFTINVNLNDRKKLKYNFLVGRNLLIGNYNVDASQSFVQGQKE
jgi:hypothetical protein